MSKFLVDCDAMPDTERAALESALAPLAESDLPLAVELLFVSEEEIRALNRRERRVDSVTDVLSFPAMELVPGAPVLSEEHGECVESLPCGNGERSEDSRMYLGSVAICRRRAEEQAEEYGHSLAREIFYLAVHGVLHCLGYDHESDGEKRAMRALEEEVMVRLNLGRES